THKIRPSVGHSRLELPFSFARTLKSAQEAKAPGFWPGALKPFAEFRRSVRGFHRCRAAEQIAEMHVHAHRDHIDPGSARGAMGRTHRIAGARREGVGVAERVRAEIEMVVFDGERECVRRSPLETAARRPAGAPISSVAHSGYPGRTGNRGTSRGLGQA